MALKVGKIFMIQLQMYQVIAGFQLQQVEQLVTSGDFKIHTFTADSGSFVCI